MKDKSIREFANSIIGKKLYKQIVIAALFVSATVPIIVTYPLYIVLDTFANRGPKGFLAGLLALFLVSIFIWVLSSVVFLQFKKLGLPNWVHLVVTSIVGFLLVGTGWIAIYVNIAKPTMDPEKLGAVRVFLGTTFNLVVHLVLVLIWRKEENLRVVKNNASLQIDNLEAKYKLLKEQINPHFLFNALNISKSLVKRDPDKAEKFIVQLSDFLRASFQNEKKANSLRDEMALGKGYLELQSVRFDGAINDQINLDESKLDDVIPYFTMVSLVENAIKHNAFSKRKKLQLEIFTEEDYLVVRNNVKPKKGVTSTNTGLTNLDERSVLLSNNRVIVEATDEFFTVKVKLVPA